jgi:hypothetical protein
MINFQTALIATAALRRRLYRFEITTRGNGGDPQHAIMEIFDNGTATVDVVGEDGEFGRMPSGKSIEMAQVFGYILRGCCDNDNDPADVFCAWGRRIEQLVGSGDELIDRIEREHNASVN